MARPKGLTDEKRGVARGECPPVSTLIAGLKAGQTAAEIARIYGVVPGTVHAALRRHGISIRDLRHWQERKADVLDHLQMRLVEHMTPEKMAQASLRDQATTFNILHNAERLVRGQSTSNVGINALLETEQQLAEQIRQLESELGMDTDKPLDSPADP